jgi:hypothetical protein
MITAAGILELIPPSSSGTDSVGEWGEEGDRGDSEILDPRLFHFPDPPLSRTRTE